MMVGGLDLISVQKSEGEGRAMSARTCAPVPYLRLRWGGGRARRVAKMGGQIQIDGTPSKRLSENQ